MHVSFQSWTRQRDLVSVGTNAGSEVLPFQTWHHFKEAFAPELVARAVKKSELEVHRCCDPFGGSGTSALACQFLGVHPVAIEVNPFLADLVIAKLYSYDPDHLIHNAGVVIRRVRANCETPRPSFLPATFVEPGKDDRWLFDRCVADRVFQYLGAIDSLGDLSHQRLFKVLLGGCLVRLSNVRINGKGRRYRRNWRKRTVEAGDVDRAFSDAVYGAIREISRYTPRLCASYSVVVGDCRKILPMGPKAELCVCSPPYPNSFDYTDIYNLELWMLGYLTDRSDNTRLRESTLCSHVQVGRAWSVSPAGSEMLNDALGRLRDESHRLWNPRIPDMVAGYFTDMVDVLRGIARSLVDGGTAWIVIGDSRYAGVPIASARILEELMPQTGLSVDSIEPCRSMRNSAQQGGQRTLSEALLVLKKIDTQKSVETGFAVGIGGVVEEPSGQVDGLIPSN